MAVDFGRIFGKALSYSLSFDKLLPFFALNALFFSFVVFSIDSLIDFLPYVEADLNSMPMAAKLSLGGFVSVAFVFILLAFILALAKIFLSTAVTENARLSYGKKDKPLAASFKTVKNRYFSVLVATLLVSIIGMVASSVPVIGWLLNFFVSLLFLFIIQSIIISNKDAPGSLRDSYKLFMQNKFNVILFWFIMTLIGFFIIFIAIMPLALALVPLFVSGAIDKYSLLFFVRDNIGMFFACSILFSVAAAYLDVFTEAAKTFFYIGLKKK